LAASYTAHFSLSPNFVAALQHELRNLELEQMSGLKCLLSETFVHDIINIAGTGAGHDANC